MRLTEHARTMAQGVYQVAEGFYVAVGYSNANMTMVVGSDGVLLVDSLENAEAASEALADLRWFGDKPILALIYTHSHPDHTSGVRGLLDPAEIEQGQVAIYAHERLTTGMRGNSSLRLMPPLRLAYSFGFDLEPGPDGLVEVGLGPLLRTGTTGFLPPTTTFAGSLDIEVTGIRVHLREAPSESDSGTSYGVAIRSDVMDLLAEAPDVATLNVQTSDPTLRALLTGRIAWQRAVENGTAALNSGSADEGAQFWSLFDPPMGELPALALR